MEKEAHGKRNGKWIHRGHTSGTELEARHCILEREISPLSHEIVIFKIKHGDMPETRTYGIVDISQAATTSV
jgi:hypothetical protein